ncbi:MAG TPA: sigma-70 family RNA polymerase sigma factor [bacterium]|nr:sigma-70 family RNA polymerase sigma factor [bacterium]HPQ19076.1 sigma-70 family RNA polymerase sigma factor [bacterium]
MNKYENLNDDDLIKLYKKGDKMAMQFLMEKYHQYLFKIGYSFLNNKEDIEDLIQDTYIKIIKNIKQYKMNNYFKYWITRMLKNNIINFYKKKKINVLDETQLFALNNVEDNSPDTMIQLLNEERIAIINSIINEELKEEKKKIIEMKFNENLKAKEIAEKLKMPLNTVLTSIHYSLIKIKDKLKEKGYLSN